MWRNYLTVGIRSLVKSRTYSIINIAGLAIGMAACLMILLFIRYEHSYDQWLPDVENTYQFQAWYAHPRDGDPLLSADVRLRHQGAHRRRISRKSSSAVYVQDNEPSSSKMAKPRPPRIGCSPTTTS